MWLYIAALVKCQMYFSFNFLFVTVIPVDQSQFFTNPVLFLPLFGVFHFDRWENFGFYF